MSTADRPSVDQHAVEILQQLIRFNTTNPPGNEAACIAYIDGLLRQADIETVILGRSASLTWWRGYKGAEAPHRCCSMGMWISAAKAAG